MTSTTTAPRRFQALRRKVRRGRFFLDLTFSLLRGLRRLASWFIVLTLVLWSYSVWGSTGSPLGALGEVAKWAALAWLLLTLAEWSIHRAMRRHTAREEVLRAA